MNTVCHVTSAHSSDDIRIFEKECVSLAKAGYCVSLVAAGASFIKENVNVIGVKRKKGGRLYRILFFSGLIIRKAVEINADIYHLHDPELLPYAKKLKKLGKIVIFDSHEDVPAQITEKKWIPKFLRGIIAYTYEKFQNHTCASIDSVIVVTPHIYDKFVGICPKIFLITNYPIQSTQNAVNNNDSKCNNSICFAGGISEQWCHEVVIEAISRFFDTKYTLCGSGRPDYINKLQKLSGWKHVNFLGRIPHMEVIELLPTCAAGMALLKKGANTGGALGTIGNTKIFEYMQAGIPVICTDFDLWKEIVLKHECGICVNPTDIKEVSEAIEYLINNPIKAQLMGQNGKSAVWNFYNWRTEEAKLLLAYSELLS